MPALKRSSPTYLTLITSPTTSPAWCWPAKRGSGCGSQQRSRDVMRRAPPGSAPIETSAGLSGVVWAQAGAARAGGERGGWRGLRGAGPDPPLIRRQHPRQADHVITAERLDDDPAPARHARVERDLAGIDDPEPAGRGSLVEQAPPGGHRDVLAYPGQLA